MTAWVRKTGLSRRGPILTAGIALLAIGGTLPSGAAAGMQVWAEGIAPNFRADNSDYTVTCPTGKTKFRVRGANQAQLGEQAPESGNFQRQVKLVAGQAIKLREGDKSFYFRCRPLDLPVPRLERTGRTQGKIYLTTPSIDHSRKGLLSNYVMAVNRFGVPLWWKLDLEGAPMDLKALDKNSLAWAPAKGNEGLYTVRPNSYQVRALDGRLEKKITPTAYGADHHEMQRTPDGGYLTISYVPRRCPEVPQDCEDLSAWKGPKQANMLDSVIQKHDSRGKLVWNWNSRDHIPTEEAEAWKEHIVQNPYLSSDRAPAYDTVHVNAMEPDGGGVIVTARHLNAVFRIKDPQRGGAIDWKLGGTKTNKSLKITGDRKEYKKIPFSGPHDARRLKDGTVSVFDNRSGVEGLPRAEIFRITGNRAELIKEITDPEIDSSFCCGSARVMPGGNTVISWGGRQRVGEYDKQGKRIFSVNLPLSSYRAVPAAQLEEQSLREGMQRGALMRQFSPELEPPFLPVVRSGEPGEG